MARMIPASLAADTKSDAEKRLFSVLRDGLDDRFTVFHSFDLLVHNRLGKLVDGEIDFLIFSPHAGFLVLEVKGGSIRYDGEQGIWYQNERPLKTSPFDQAKTCKYKLERFLEKRLGHSPGCTFAHAVCFPDVYARLKTLPSGAEPEICITGRQLDQIGQAVSDVLGAFRDNCHRAVSEREAQQLREIIMPYCEYGTSLVDRMGQAEQVIFRLTENQCQLLDFIGRHRRVLIEGCAGSGKTIMAVKKARELAAEGRSVLLLAYNVMIGEQLAGAVSDLENVTASHYHGFCLDLLREAEMEPPAREDSDYWERQIPEAFVRLMQNSPIKYDALIVDEGQDFLVEYWLTITDLVSDDGFLYIFYDRDQNLFGAELDFPIDKEPFVLDENCRNTRTIFDKLTALSERSMRLNPDAPGGEPVVEYTIRDTGVRRRQVGKILHDLVNNKGIEPHRIVILGGHSMGHTCIGDNSVIGMFRITETTEEGPNVINYRTYMKFKGCEADAVIIIDVDPADERWANPAAHYTAVSRAKHLLYVLRSGGEGVAK